jgi:hypothetical protein
MTCQCGAEALDQKGMYACGMCGRHCIFCTCARLAEIAIPDTRAPIPEGPTWSEGDTCH